MDWHDAALGLAGVIGSGVAVGHGVLVQRLIVRPIGAAGATHFSAPVRRLVPGLLQFSTFNWFICGLALIAASAWLARDARVAIGLLAGSSYLFGAVGNFWSTRGRHPGWMLYAIALALIVFGLQGSS